MNGIKIYRFANYLHKKKVPLLPRILQRLIYILYNAHIPCEADIGEGTLLGYGGMGIVIHTNAKIGKNCMILQQVTIGTAVPFFDMNNLHPVPIIEDNVYIASGAKILGGITIGEGSVIGANSVVTKDIPRNSLVLGIPGKVIKKIENKAILTK
ncbi:serine O-acetyltransferase [Aliarcobacter butzleri]|uniref:serine O-acetyltransferase n=1 Tax=Aliarcobacter butzleri TaxID=28197 RepID=UPI0024DE0983|nr:serine O-acetyltransferase [Aliarcobacter butzleri]MDK2046963.1 serine O-acetyltransferase [Aliarcobacter butzleri]